MIRESFDIFTITALGITSIILLILSAMASGSEAAFFSLSRTDIEALEQKNDAKAHRVLDLLSNPDRLLATILVTNNMINICLVIVVTQLVDAIFIFSGVWELILPHHLSSCAGRCTLWP